MTKILIIDDDKDLLETLSEILQIHGYEVVPAIDGQEGIEQAIETLPDLIFCDIGMPQLDGFEVLSTLRNSLNEIELPPFIFLTAKTSREDTRHGMSLGAADYITKPYDMDEILDTVKIHIDNRIKLKQSVLTNERERISDELHNGIQSSIVAANMGLKIISKMAKTLTPEELKILKSSSDILDLAITDTRNLSHNLISGDLDILERKELKQYLSKLIDLLSVSSKITFDFDIVIEQWKNKKLELLICRAIQEMITNTIKHSNADKVSLRITEDKNNLIIYYEDNGIGFDTTKTLKNGGLNAIQKIIEKLNGKLLIKSSLGKGVSYHFTVKM